MAEAKLPPGLTLIPDAITPGQEAAFLEACARCELQYYEQDPGNPRSRKSFGWQYDIPSDRFVESEPVPADLREACEIAASHAGVTADDIIDCMVIRYEPGSLIQPHYDKGVFDRIMGLSMASDTVMVFSKPEELGGEEIAVELPRRSLFMLAGDARFVYRHGIPRVTETRWSMSFRTLTEAGETLRASFEK